MKVVAVVGGKEYAPKRDGVGARLHARAAKARRHPSASCVHSRSEAGTKRRRITGDSDVLSPFSLDRGGRRPSDTRCRIGDGAPRRRTRPSVNRIVSKRNGGWDEIRFPRRRRRDGQRSGVRRRGVHTSSEARTEWRRITDPVRLPFRSLEMSGCGSAEPRDLCSRRYDDTAGAVPAFTFACRDGTIRVARRRSQRPAVAFSAPMSAIRSTSTSAVPTSVRTDTFSGTQTSAFSRWPNITDRSSLASMKRVVLC